MVREASPVHCEILLTSAFLDGKKVRVVANDIDNKVTDMGDMLVDVGGKVGEVGNKVEEIGDRVQRVDDKVQVAIDGARSCTVSCYIF